MKISYSLLSKKEIDINKIIRSSFKIFLYPLVILVGLAIAGVVILACFAGGAAGSIPKGIKRVVHTHYIG